MKAVYKFRHHLRGLLGECRILDDMGAGYVEEEMAEGTERRRGLMRRFMRFKTSGF